MMRGRIVGIAGIVVALTAAAWIGAAPAAEHEASAPSTPAVVLEIIGRSASPSTIEPSPGGSLGQVPIPSAVAQVPAGSGGEALAFVDELNELRGARGLPQLTRRVDLDSLAQSWARQMADDDNLRHSEMIYDVITGSWTTAGENVGYGPSVGVIFAALESSEGHLDNMVNPDFTAVGIGAARVGDVLWTAHLFAG